MGSANDDNVWMQELLQIDEIAHDLSALSAANEALRDEILEEFYYDDGNQYDDDKAYDDYDDEDSKGNLENRPKRRQRRRKKQRMDYKGTMKGSIPFLEIVIDSKECDKVFNDALKIGKETCTSFRKEGFSTDYEFKQCGESKYYVAPFDYKEYKMNRKAEEVIG